MAKHLEDIFIFAYICSIKITNNMTTQDFSEATLQVFTEAKNGNIPVSDFVDILIESDFSKTEILMFVKKEFRSIYKYIKSYIN